MCMVSVIADYGRTRVAPEDWTRPAWNEYKQILDQLREIDDKLNQPDCEDTKKTDWMKDVEDRLVALERQ